VEVAGTVKKALDTISEGVFDLVTLDLNLGGERSDAVAEALRERRIPFLFSTGYGEIGVDEDFQDYVVLPKPYTSCQLLDAVSKVLPT
jgi:CheY-like chemotaxis protein